MDQNSLDLVIAGLGDQPLAYACFVLARLAQNKGLEVQILQPQTSACKGLAHVRIAPKATRNPIGEGQADILLGLEPADAVRALPFLKKDGIAVVNMPDSLTEEALSKAVPEVEQPLARLQGCNLDRMDTLTMARRMGLPVAVVTILLGMLSKHLPFSSFDWRHAIGCSVPRKTFAGNIQAFMAGRGEAEEQPAPRCSLIDDADMTKKDDECSDITM